eukprot:scaffold19051_cov138-Isochrysis_galbana.AAC.1
MAELELVFGFGMSAVFALPLPRRHGASWRHKGAGKGASTSCFEGGGSARGGLPTPLSGREAMCVCVGPTEPHQTTHTPTSLAATRRVTGCPELSGQYFSYIYMR